jgi:succinyl-diaminopimelate desuccinylase
VDDVADWVAVADSFVSDDRLRDICAQMVSISSPTGEERVLAEWLASELQRMGLDGRTQVLSPHSANVHGRYPTASTIGAAASLLLYAPIDTVTSGDPDEDLPWIGPHFRADHAASARTPGELVVGLGAQNPKGHGACIVAAAEALRRAEVPLNGDLLVGFGAGGMPTNRRRADLIDGHGVGCAALVKELRPDAAVIAKTGWAVSWAEVGVTWFDVQVHGTHSYVGSRHLLPYRSAIGDAAHIVAGLEKWFHMWTDQYKDELVAPQGAIGAIEGGWSRMPSFPPAMCRFFVDIRLSPRTSPDDAAKAFGEEVDRLAKEIGATVTWTQTVAIPGSMTDQTEPVIVSSIRSWETLTGRAHAPMRKLSGATDANILRAMDVPTARVGLPKVTPDSLAVAFGATYGTVDVPKDDFELGMNAVDVRDMVQLTKLLIRIAIDFLGVAT